VRQRILGKGPGTVGSYVTQLADDAQVHDDGDVTEGVAHEGRTRP
jgi:hypothetical protein